ncbi:MAG: hypothetical protein HUU15_10700, partial [Candidatus Brocadiae bacterium]|nr:hypothetical protein [Candidatus Brocadiia bacterium]
GSPDFAAMIGPSAGTTSVLALRATGEPLWQQSLTPLHGTSPGALADWDGDGADDVAIAVNTARVYSGPTGGVIADSGGFLAYFMPLLADTTGDGAPEATLQGGQYPARTLSHDLGATLWQGEDDRPYPYGALAECGPVKKLVEGSLAFPSRIAITTISGAAPGERITRVLAGGEVFASEDEAAAAGAQLGQLGDVTVSANLTGADAAPTALVGSTDGYLYAVDSCTGDLRWARAFEAPVGAPILTDTDGDGNDDIVVSVADGYVYGLRHEVLPAPELVWDVDPPHGATGEDLDEIETRDTLYVLWSPVEQAESYEIAVVGAAGAYLTSPAWIDVGAATTATVNDRPAGKQRTVRAPAASGCIPGRIPLNRRSDGTTMNAHRRLRPPPPGNPPWHSRTFIATPPIRFWTVSRASTTWCMRRRPRGRPRSR